MLLTVSQNRYRRSSLAVSRPAVLLSFWMFRKETTPAGRTRSSKDDSMVVRRDGPSVVLPASIFCRVCSFSSGWSVSHRSDDWGAGAWSASPSRIRSTSAVAMTVLPLPVGALRLTDCSRCRLRYSVLASARSATSASSAFDCKSIRRSLTTATWC